MSPLQRTASIRELICKEIGCEIAARPSTLASGGLRNTVRASEAAKAGRAGEPPLERAAGMLRDHKLLSWGGTD